MKRFSFLTTLFVFLLAVSATFAAIPQLIPYQANVIDAESKALNGVYSVTFELFDSPNGGTPMWTVNRSVSIENGYINVMLGDVNPLTGVDFKKQLYLQVTIGNGTPYPRTKLGSTPYAIQAISAVDADTALVAKDVVDGVLTWNKFNPAAIVAGGDLQGTYPNPTLRSGVVLENILPGSITQKYLAPNVTVPPSGKAGGDLSGQYPDPIIAKGAVKTDRIADGAVTLEKMANNSVKSSNIIDNSVMLADLNDEVKNLGGDLDGTLPNPTVVGFQGKPVSAYAPWDGAVYMYSEPYPGSGTWVPMNAEGDIAGPYNDLQIQPGTVGSLELLDGSIYDVDVAADAAIAGTKIYPDFGFQDIITTGDLHADNGYFNFDVYGDDFHGTTFHGTNGMFDNLTVDVNTMLKGVTTIDSPLHFNGAMDGVNNVMLDGEQLPASSDLDGYYPAPKIRDLAVTVNKIATGAVTGDKIFDGTITDADVAGNAAIKGSKILPDFGNQTIKTTGSFDVGGNITNSGGANVIIDDNLIVTGNLTVNGTINLANVNAVNVTAQNGLFTNLTVTNPIIGSMSKSLTDGQGIATFTYNGGADAVVNVNVDAATIGINGADALYLMDNAVTNAKIADNAVTINEMADNSVGEDELIATAVVAGTYGTQTEVAQFAVDADGRLTFAQNVAILVNDDAVSSDIDITGTNSDMLNLQIRPNTVGSDEIIDGSVSALDLNSAGEPKGRQLTANGTGGVFWSDALALPYEGSLATGEDAFKIFQNNANGGTAAIFNSTIASNMDNAVEITKDISNGAGSALYVYGIGVMGQNYIAKFENQNLNEGRTALFTSTSPAGLTGVNAGFDAVYGTIDDFVNLDPTDVIEATVVVDNNGVNNSNQQLALKSYGSIQANSAVIASNLVGVKMLTLGDGTTGYGEILAPVPGSGQNGTPQMYVNPGMYIDGSVDITGTTHGVMAADFDATMNVDGNTTLNANVALGDNDLDNVVFNADVNSNILPQGDNAWDLGSVAKSWNDIYYDGTLFGVNIYLTGNLDVDGNTRLGNQLSDAVVLNGTITSTLGPVYVNDQFNVTGAADFDNTLNVDGAATFNNAITQTNAAAQVAFAGNVDAQNGLDVTGANFTVGTNQLVVNVTNGFISDNTLEVTIDDDAWIKGITTLGDNIASDFVSFNAKVATAILPTLDNNAAQDLGSAVNRWNDIFFGGMLTGGDATFNNLTVLDNTTLGNAIGDAVVLNGTITSAIGPVYINDLLNVTGNVDFDANFNLDGTAATVGANPFTVADDFRVNLTTTLVGTLDAQSAIFNTTANNGGQVYINDALEVVGAADFDNTLNADGNTTLNANVTLGDAAADYINFLGLTSTILPQGDNAKDLGSVANSWRDIYWDGSGYGNNLNLVGNLNVDGNTRLGNAAGDNIDLQGTIFNTLAAVTINDAINQTGGGQVTFSGNVDATNGLDVTGANLTVGTTQLVVDVTNGYISDATGDVTVNDNLVVTGTSDLQGNVFDSNSDLVINDNLNVTGNTDLDGTLNVDGTVATVGANPFRVADDFNVSGITTLDGNVALGNAAADMITFPGLVNSDVLPVNAGNWDLGGPANQWQDIYYDGTLYGGDGHFQNLRVDINTDLRGPIFNTTQNTSLTPLQFADDMMPTINNTFDVGTPALHWRNMNTDALNTWGPGGITVNNAGGISIVGSGGLNIASGGAVITGGITSNGEITANGNINAKFNIYNSGGNVTVNDNLDVTGNYKQSADGGTVLGYSTVVSLATLNSCTGTVINYGGPAGLIDATVDFPAGVNGKIIYIENNSGAGILVWNLSGTTGAWGVAPGDMATFVYVNGWRVLN